MLSRLKPLIEKAEKKCLKIIEGFEDSPQIYADEPDITSKLCERIKDGLNFSSGKTKIESCLLTLKSREEALLGGDVLILTNFNSVQLKLSLGVLMQAKIIKDDKSIGSNSEMNRLKKQCADMHEQTDHAYVWIYDRPDTAHQKMDNKSGLPKKYRYKSIRATLVENLNTISPHNAFNIPLSKFFKDIMSGYIGDKDININNPQRIAEIASNLSLSHILIINSDIGPDLEPTSQVDISPSEDMSDEIISIVDNISKSLDEFGVDHTIDPNIIDRDQNYVSDLNI